MWQLTEEFNMYKVVVTDQSFGNVNYERKMAEDAGARFFDYQCTTEEETIAAVEGADVIFNNFAPMNKTVLKHIKENAVIIRYGVGVDNVDLEAARKNHIRVCNVPDYGVEEVADHASAFILALCRKLPLFNEAVHDGKWKVATIAPKLKSLRDTTLGLLGFGRIARALAERMKPFGVNIIAYDPYIDENIATQYGIRIVDLDTLFINSNILSLHLPFNKETKYIVNSNSLEKMPQDSIIINVSRGGLIDENALAKAIEAGHISGTGLDVFEQEPPSINSVIMNTRNVLTSPHAAFFSDRSVQNLQKLAAEEGSRALKKQPLRCPVC